VTNTATRAATPQWLLQIFEEIDAQKFGEGFSHMTEDTDLYLGTAHVHGVEAIKEFFLEIDRDLNVTHRAIESWTAEGGVCLTRLEATVAKKAEPDKVVHAPSVNVTYLEEGEPVRIKTMYVTAGPVDPAAKII
jgi:hypothetical protein